MTKYSGARLRERKKLNAPQAYTVSGISFGWTASGAIGRALVQLRKDLAAMDKRTNATKNLQAAMKRLERLQKAISR